MKVFKFGGASVKSAEAVRNVVKIVAGFEGNIVIVVSAMGKMTNMFEDLVRAYFNQESDKAQEVFSQIKDFHLGIIEDLFKPDGLPKNIEGLFNQIDIKLRTKPTDDYDFEYDQLICFGELLSTQIVADYLNIGRNVKWIDIRESLRTNSQYREALVDWDFTEKKIQETFNFKGQELFVTQGFIGSTNEGKSTSLGREGSDFTGAILANILNAESLTIWKDVPGVLNADPKLLDNTVMLNELSYREAIEMAHSGAKVIHPKTIKPLQNKNIPLFVKSFLDPGSPGTLIHPLGYKLELTPVFISKKNQVLITLSPIDFSFVGIEDMRDVFNHFPGVRFKVNLFQQSAIDLNLVIDHPEFGLDTIIEGLSEKYEVKYNTGIELITIRYYNDEVVAKQVKGRKIYIEQKSRKTARLVLK